jgi:hypothetical protein
MSDNKKPSNIKYLFFAMLLGIAVGYFLMPEKVEVKVEEKVVEKIVTREIEKKNTQKKNNKTVVIVETKLPDGTFKKETRIVDKGKVELDFSKDSKSKYTAETEKTSFTTVTGRKDSVIISIMAGAKFTDLTSAESVAYGVHVQKTIFGPFTIGAFGFTDKRFGASAGIKF